MKLYLTDGKHWTGTQADAKAAGDTFVPIEVPTDKPSLIPFLQKLQDKITELRTKRDTAPEPVEIVTATGETKPLVIPEIVEVATPVPTVSSVGQIENLIDTMDGASLIRVLTSAIPRLAEVAGTAGWAAFAKETYAWSPGAKRVEQGMGMLMLAAFNNFEAGKAE